MHKILLVILLSSLMSACATFPQKSSLPQPAPSKAILQFTQWQLRSKVAIQTAHESFTAYGIWRQNKDQAHLQLLSPLGTVIFTLDTDPKQAILKTGNHKIYTAKNPDDLLAKMGLPLPASHLFYWIRGLSDPKIPAQKTLNANGQLQTLTQEGWEIKFLSYVPNGNLVLPRLMLISNGQIKIKMFNSWN